ncbi:hypothetical protein AGLY_003458 [Aphis glycines]|uniref:BED-type domain-containing protein n=1 Tax=Aphis glycines TaxID=307491 RepID=A0A6G0TZP3_APHGL|nr:hypothetical protein AGLY_003458 [Aphis glycines]
MAYLTERRKDNIWHEFDEVVVLGKPKRTICKHCGMEMASIVARMKNHYNETCKRENIQENVNEPLDDILDVPDVRPSGFANEGVAVVTNKYLNSSTGTNSNVQIKRKSIKGNESLCKFVVKTSSANKVHLDLQVARFVYATNSSFLLVQHHKFKKLISLLRPGYNPPTRQSIANDLLNSIARNGKIVCIALDSWSNIHNDSIVSLQYCEKFECTVGNLVTDNA